MVTRSFFAVVLLVAAAPSVRAEETDEQRAAAKLLATTVTVRIAPNEAPPKADGANEAEGVMVCSGTSLGRGRILTFLPPAKATSAAAEWNYRVTLPDGAQAAAQPAVIDQYSGLLLLKIESHELPGLALADELPKIGGAVLTASAAGIEQPLVSMGVLSGVDRTISGTALPPMIQCDISTTEAASGAAIIDKPGRLIGVIAATGASSERFGWSYAIPYPCIERVLAAAVPDRLVVLVRRRPTIGLQLGPGPQEGTVQVERVIAGGPADQAGIRQGDVVYEAQGCKVRSAYQVVALILKRQPGDKVSLVVGQAEQRQAVEVTLGGGAAAVEAQLAEGAVQVGPQVNLRLSAPDRLEVRNRQGVAEVSVDQKAPPVRSAGEEVDLLKAQLRAYQNVIEALQQELAEEKRKNAER